MDECGRYQQCIYTHILYIYLWKATFLRSLNGHGVFELFSHLGVRAFCEVIKVPKNHPWFSQWANVGAWVLRYSPWYCCCLGRIWWLPHVWGKRKKRQYFWNKMQPLVLFQAGPIAPLKQSQGTEQTIKACWSVEFSEAFVFALPWQEDEAGSQLGIWKQFFRWWNFGVFSPDLYDFQLFGVS